MIYIYIGFWFSRGSAWWLGVLHMIFMVVRDSPQNFHGGLDSLQNLQGGYGFPTGSVWWWLGILHRIWMVLWDFKRDLNGGLGFPTGFVYMCSCLWSPTRICMVVRGSPENLREYMYLLRACLVINCLINSCTLSKEKKSLKRHNINLPH